jgi:hypothetical protein
MMIKVPRKRDCAFQNLGKLSLKLLENFAWSCTSPRSEPLSSLNTFNAYYSWPKEFLEAGKRRLAGVAARKGGGRRQGLF